MREAMLGRLVLVACAVLASSAESLAQPIGTGFTYQGRLVDGAVPASGTYDLTLTLFDASAGGSAVGSPVSLDDVVVTNGLFVVPLDFGAAFSGSKRWLQVAVRPGASTGSYATLSPRQELTPSPSAVFSSTAPWPGIAGKPPGFADDTDDDALGGLACATGQVPRRVGTSWTCGDANAHDHTAQTWNASVPTGQAFRVINSGTGGFSDGIWGQSDATAQGRGVVGYATGTDGQTFGVWGQSDASNGRAVMGLSTATGFNGTGVFGQSNGPGVGVRGEALSAGVGVLGRTESHAGVLGNAVGSTSNTGVWGVSTSPAGRGLYGTVAATTGTNFAILGDQSQSPSGYAGYFNGRLHVNGTLSKAAGSFKIDHPLDPENKYLYHSFVESPDMKNIYDGVVTTDADGYATVELPEWFEALNRDFRYQLTVVGEFAQAIVARKIADNRFTIRTDRPRVEVCWLVTGTRQDAFAEKHRIPVEEPKPDDERGTLLTPEAFGRPAEDGLAYKRRAVVPPVP